MSEEKKSSKLQTATNTIILAGSLITLIVGGVFAIETRYAKVNQVTVDLNSAKNEIIRELTEEVSRNRTAMIADMQRQADDIEYEMKQLAAAGKPIPRYLEDKLKTLDRDIENLKK